MNGNLHINSMDNQTVYINGVDLVGKLVDLERRLEVFTPPEDTICQQNTTLFSNVSDQLQVLNCPSFSSVPPGFGYRVDLLGFNMAVSARSLNNTGAVFVFSLDQHESGQPLWTHKATLGPALPSMEAFGNTLAMYNGGVAVGTVRCDRYGTSGCVHIFCQIGDQWALTDVLAPSSLPTSFHADFGNELAIDQSLMVVAARYDRPFGYLSGSAFVFKFNATGSGKWEESAKLVASDGEPYDVFGDAIDLHEGVVVVGAFEDRRRTGSVYVFEQDDMGTWFESAKILASDGRAGDAFGHWVNIFRDTIAVGAPHASNNGVVYVFDRSTNSTMTNWIETSRLFSRDSGQFQFGVPGDLIGDTLAVASRKKFEIHIYKLQYGVWNLMQLVDGFPTSAGTEPGYFEPRFVLNPEGQIASLVAAGSWFTSEGAVISVPNVCFLSGSSPPPSPSP